MNVFSRGTTEEFLYNVKNFCLVCVIVCVEKPVIHTIRQQANDRAGAESGLNPGSPVYTESYKGSTLIRVNLENKHLQ